MKYNQPYGISDPNGPYINGNPSTGTMGSIPPAASIEFDQREIVEVINYAFTHGYRDNTGTLCAAPSDADLTQLRKAIWGFINSNRLALNLDYYVSQSGSDSNNGLSSATPFATIQHAINISQMFDPNGFTITIHVADGNYSFFNCGLGGNLKGFGVVNLIGNLTNPGNVIVTAPAGVAAIAAWFIGGTRNYNIGGFKIVSLDNRPESGDGIRADSFANVRIYNCEFGLCYGNQILAATNSYITLAGMIDQIAGVPWPFIHVSGNGTTHMRCSEGGGIGCHSPDITIMGAVSISQWAMANDIAHIGISNDPAGSQPNFYNSITGKANVTGSKYFIDLNSIINTGGSGASYFPGTIAGAIYSGGQYQ